MGKLVFAKHYDPEKYPKYDEIDAINVDKISEIPDYPGVMGGSYYDLRRPADKYGSPWNGTFSYKWKRKVL